MADDPMAIERALLIETLRPAGEVSFLGTSVTGSFFVSVRGDQIAVIGWTPNVDWFRCYLGSVWLNHMTFADAMTFARQIAAGIAL